MVFLIQAIIFFALFGVVGCGSDSPKKANESALEVVDTSTDTTTTTETATKDTEKKLTISEPLLGKWISDCRYIGGSEYILEQLSFPKDKTNNFSLTVSNSDNSDCDNPYMTVVQEFQYSVGDENKVESDSGSEFDMSLSGTTITIGSKEIEEAFNEHCQETFEVDTSYKVDKSGLNCGNLLRFPANNTRYYQVIRIKNKKLAFGEPFFAVNASSRPKSFAQYDFGFKK